MNLLLEKRMKRVMEKRGGHSLTKEMKRLAKMQHIKYVNLQNARWCKENEAATDIRTFDGETPNPISQAHFSPFMANVYLLRDWPMFMRDQGMRDDAAKRFWPQIKKLLIHLEHKHWKLFDKEFQKLELNLPIKSEADRLKAVFKAIELTTMFFTPFTDAIKQRIRQRITFAESTSAKLVSDLVRRFQTKQKDESIFQELRSIRDRWSQYYGFLAPIYTSIYWDDTKHTLDDFTLAHKRFQELKPFYVDCFETFCRISVIAAGLEGIIVHKTVGVPDLTPIAGHFISRVLPLV
jgi:hypothetical protein